MPKNKPQQLNEVIFPFAPEGANDKKWHRVEHQLIQAKFSLEDARSILVNIIHLPENTDDETLARDCYGIVKSMYVDFLGHYTTLLSYLSVAVVPDRISRKEQQEND